MRRQLLHVKSTRVPLTKHSTPAIARIRHHQRPVFHAAATSQRRSFAIYAVGEGWTGALTQKYVLETIPGHFDEDSDADDEGAASPSPTTTLPVCIHPNNDISQVAVGWGTTCFIDSTGTLHVVGRPHDLMSLLRMNRMPTWLRNWVLKTQQQQTIVQQTSCNPTPDTTVTPVGSAISHLIGWATGVDNTSERGDANWELAQKYSYLADWTAIEAPQNQQIQQVACGPGLLAFIGTEGGILYTMGVNNRGQCGVGSITNNVWTPTPVLGLTTIRAKRKSQAITATDQEYPIVQVALGFQHGYALNTAGHVYSWGKAQRGQLGRDDIDFDQDAYAGLVVFPNKHEKVIEIAAGHHHGAALTENGQVHVWGKNMGRDEATKDGKDLSETSNKPVDARMPQLVQGIPTTCKVKRITCGSHHTSILMEDGSVYAIGIASDEAVPILTAVEIIPPGILELPVQQFEAHQDRTTVVDNDRNVYQAHLWLDESLREYAYFTPAYVDTLMDEGKSIQAIHRGWRHTVIVTSSK